jgi:DNA-binding transcriptional MerR regulator
MDDHAELIPIGQLARRTGLPVRTIRFWSDAGLLPPAGRSAGGYRLYDAESVVRLDLVRTLRDLGLDLDTVERVLRRQTTVAEVALMQVNALDAEIRTLRLRRAVLAAVAHRATTTEEMRLVHRLARLSAQERQRIIDDFVDQAFEGLDPQAPGMHIAAAMRRMPAELPDEPTAEQVEAWVELAELVAEPSFRQRVRQMAVAGAQAEAGAEAGAAEAGDGGSGPAQRSEAPPFDPAPVIEHAGGALAAGIAPESAEGGAVLDRIVDPGTSAADRARLADRLETFTDRRVERYWQLVGVVNGRPPVPPSTPAFEWLIAALRAHGRLPR